FASSCLARGRSLLGCDSLRIHGDAVREVAISDDGLAVGSVGIHRVDAVFERAQPGWQTGRRDPPQWAGPRRGSHPVFMCGHRASASFVPARIYSAGTAATFVKFG